jgi:hypothetical protein
MHTIQIMLVTADSEQEAYERVQFYITEHINPEWSDWHNAAGMPPFAGRWTGGVFLTEAQIKELSEKEMTDDEASFTGVPDILCYADNPELAEYTLARFASDVKQEMRECMPVGIDLNTLVTEYSSYSSIKTPSSMEFWQLKRVIDMLSGEWTPDSRFFDLETGYPTLAHFSERCEKEPQKQYLVPVDFHY